MTIDRKTIIDALDYAGLSEDDLREDYSGRGMYGAKCFGIVCTLGELLSFVAAYAENITQAGEGEWDWVRGASSDAMGLGTIWYWPNVQLGEEDE